VSASRTDNRRRARTRERKANLVVIGVGALVVLLAVVAVLVGSGDSVPPDEAGEVQPVEVAGSIAPLPASGNDPGVGQEAPRATGSTFEGQGTTVGEGPSLLLFVAHWCGHCQKEVPVVTDWLDGATEVRGVQIRAVSTAVDEKAPNYPPSAWLEREGWPVPTLVDDADGSVATAFGLTGFPYFVAIDGDGRVVARTSGEQPVPVLEALVDAALGQG